MTIVAEQKGCRSHGDLMFGEHVAEFEVWTKYGNRDVDPRRCPMRIIPTHLSRLSVPLLDITPLYYNLEGI